jgi:hypothetical protein
MMRPALVRAASLFDRLGGLGARRERVQSDNLRNACFSVSSQSTSVALILMKGLTGTS